MLVMVSPCGRKPRSWIWMSLFLVKLKNRGEQHADDLPGDHGYSGTGYLHPGKSEQAEDQGSDP